MTRRDIAVALQVRGTRGVRPATDFAAVARDPDRPRRPAAAKRAARRAVRRAAARYAARYEEVEP